MDFPSPRANAIQRMRTCSALARSGRATVHLILRKSGRISVDDCLRFYGLQRKEHLKIHALRVPFTGGHLSRLLFNRVFVAAVVLRAIGLFLHLRRQGFEPVIYTRDLIFADLFVFLRRFFAMKIIYEAHTIARPFFSLPMGVSHRRFPNWIRRRYERKERRVYAGAQQILAITQGLRDHIVEEMGVEPERVEVAHDGADLGGSCPPEKPLARGSQKTIGYIGHLYPNRGVDVAISALAHLPDECSLLVVGGLPDDADFNRLKGLAQVLGLSHRVTFQGFVEPRFVKNYMTKADLFVLPLQDDGHCGRVASSLKQFEYMASGRPIVASDLPCIKEILRDGENAVLVQPGDPQAMASGIRRVAEDETLARRIATTARKEIEEHFTWDRRAQKILAALETISSTTTQDNRVSSSQKTVSGGGSSSP